MARVLFVASTPMHLSMWAECIRSSVFGARGLEPAFLLFERPIAGKHEGRLTQAFGALGLPGAPLQLDPTLVLAQLSLGDTSWLAKIRARVAMMNSSGHAVQDVLARQAPALCVLGNDAGYVERLVIRHAHELRIKTLLVQDGLFYRPHRRTVAGVVRDVADRVLRMSGLEHLASNRYGHGGCDAIAVMGGHWKSVLEAEGVDAPVTVVGNPLYEKRIRRPDAPSCAPLRDTLSIPATARVFTYFTTNILTDLNDEVGHQLQLAEIADLESLLKDLYGGNHVLIVKLHPNDRVEDYSGHGLGASPTVRLVRDVEPADAIHAASVVFTSFSAVSLEAIILDKVCLLPAVRLSGSRHFATMKQLGLALPATREALRRSLVELEKDGPRASLLEQQRARLAELVSVMESRSAAERCAALMADLEGSCASS